MLCVANLPVLSPAVLLTFYVCSHLYKCFSEETSDAINWSKSENNKRFFSLQVGFADEIYETSNIVIPLPTNHTYCRQYLLVELK